MSDEYTPTVEWLEAGWIKARWPDGVAAVDASAEFKRGLALVERVAAAKALRDFADRKFGTVGPHRINMDAMYDVEMSLREEADRIESGGTA